MNRMVAIIGLLTVGCAAVWLDSDARTRGLLWLTCELSLSVAAAAVPCGSLLAFLIWRTDVRGGRLAGAILTTMLFVPLYLQAAGWDAGFGRQGWLSLSRESAAQPLLTGMRAAIWIHVLAAIPWVTLLVGVALRQLDPELEESAELETSLPGVVWHVTLPLALPAVLAAALWIAISTAGEMTVTDLYQVRTFAEEVYTTVPLLDDLSGEEVGGATLPHGTSSLFALFLLGLATASMVSRQFLSHSPRKAKTFSLGIWRIPASAVLVVAVVLIAGVPLANLLYNAGVQVDEVGGRLVRGWSLGKAGGMVAQAPRRFSSELIWSTVIAGVTATACLTLAAPLAFGSRSSRWLKRLLVGCVACGATLPGPLVGLWIIRILNRPESEWLAWLYDHSILAPVVATTFRALPAALLVCAYGFQDLAPDLLDAAAIDGLGTCERLLRVVVPIRWRILVAAWLASFVLAVGDLSTSILVTPPGLFTITARVFGLLHAGVDDQVAGLCLANAGGTVLIQLALVWFLRRE